MFSRLRDTEILKTCNVTENSVAYASGTKYDAKDIRE